MNTTHGKRPGGPKRPPRPKGPKAAPVAPSEHALDQAAARKALPLRTLPASWWHEDVAVNMAAHIERRKAVR